MANHQPTSLPFRLSLAELESLCERLRARAASMMFPDMPLMKTDLALAAVTIRAFIKRTEMKPGETIDVGNGD
jgi:hypothetical protein